MPVIGIGAGVECDGQILVSYDLLGLNDTMKPKFVKRYEELFSRGVAATRAYVDEVRSGVFPGVEHSFGVKPARENEVRVAVATGSVHAASAAHDTGDFGPLTEAHAYGPTH